MINFHRSFSLTQIPQSVSFRHKQDTYHTFHFEKYVFLLLQSTLLTLATLLISLIQVTNVSISFNSIIYWFLCAPICLIVWLQRSWNNKKTEQNKCQIPELWLWEALQENNQIESKIMYMKENEWMSKVLSSVFLVSKLVPSLLWCANSHR